MDIASLAYFAKYLIHACKYLKVSLQFTEYGL
jgi:hypothetical protein